MVIIFVSNHAEHEVRMCSVVNVDLQWSQFGNRTPDLAIMHLALHHTVTSASKVNDLYSIKVKQCSIQMLLITKLWGKINQSINQSISRSIEKQIHSAICRHMVFRTHEQNLTLGTQQWQWHKNLTPMQYLCRQFCSNFKFVSGC